MASSYDLITPIPAAREALANVEVLLDQARSIQWEKAPARHDRPKQDTSERSIGAPPADPTADVSLDEYRLAVRQAVVRAETLLRRVGLAAAATTSELQQAISDWEGESIE